MPSRPHSAETWSRSATAGGQQFPVHWGGDSTASYVSMAESLRGGLSMSMSGFPPQLRVPYQMVVPNYPTFPSVVQVMERTGHRTVAIHPFTTEMYRRSEVYRVLGLLDIHDRKAG